MKSLADKLLLTGTLGIVLLIAAVACVALIVVLRPLLVRYALARPNARSSHKEPTPQGGGIAVIAAAFGAACPGLLILDVPGLLPQFVVLTASAALLALIGAIDDVRPLGPVPKIAVHFIAVGLVVAMLPADFRFAPELPAAIERVFLIVAGVYVVNLVNFMDGIDLMTVAEVVPVTIGVLLIGFATDPLALAPAILIAGALLGATLGFAPFNWPVARLFLGDVGSLPVGLLLGWLMLMLAWHGHYTAAVLLPLYYLADASITLGRRIANREPFWEAHRSHFYQRATAGGFSVAEVIARVVVLNAALVVLALVSVLEPGHLVNLPVFLIGAGFVGWTLLTFARGKR